MRPTAFGGRGHGHSSCTPSSTARCDYHNGTGVSDAISPCIKSDGLASGDVAVGLDQQMLMDHSNGLASGDVAVASGVHGSQR